MNSLSGIHSRKLKMDSQADGFAIGSFFQKVLWCPCSDFGGVYLNPSVETNGVPGVFSCVSDLKGPYPNKSSCWKKEAFPQSGPTFVA